ncbi:MAG: hypothetical protein ABW023_00410 [Sphingomonas sp.]
MVSTSNDGIMTEYLVKYGTLKMREPSRPTDLLETLYIAERYRDGADLRAARESYDISVWSGVPAREIDERLIALDHFMAGLAKDRLESWGVKH